MPVTYVHIEWPDKEPDQIYSPSSIIENYFTPGNSISVNEFSKSCKDGLGEASERVRQKFGFACTSAQAELHRITEKCKNYTTDTSVKIISIK